jgi:hypothetical protein
MKLDLISCLGVHSYLSAHTKLQVAERGGNVDARLSGVTRESLRKLTLDSRAKPIAVLLHNKGGRFSIVTILLSVNVDGVWIGNGIYCTLMHTTHNYGAIANSHTLCKFASRCLVTDSNGGRSPYSGFPKHPRASATSL